MDNEPKQAGKDSNAKRLVGGKPSSNRPSNHQRLALRKISRARTRLVVFFWTFPVYVLGLWLLLGDGRSVEVFMLIYMAAYAGFALDMVMRRCPDCSKQFFVKTVLLNLLTRRCVHCGLAAQSSAGTDSGESESSRKF